MITYDMMKQRLQSFDHGLDPSFFTQEFWIQKGNQEIKDLKKFEEGREHEDDARRDQGDDQVVAQRAAADRT